MNSLPIRRRQSDGNRTKLCRCITAMVFLLLLHHTHASTLYWDTLAGAGNGVGGTGTWGTTFSSSATGSASLTTAATTDDLVFQGVAGVITLNANQTASTNTFNVSGYKITGNSATARSLTGAVSLANNVDLTIGNGETTDITITIGSSLSGAAGASLIVNGSATGSALTRLNFSGSGTAVSVSITVGGAGFANIASIGSTTVSGSVTGNGARLNLGATSGNSITFSNTINNGAGTVRIATGSSGGAGIVTISGSGNTWGDTELNNATSGTLRLGASDALPTTTKLVFGATSGNGDSTVDLRGFNQTISQLTSGAQSGGTITNGIATTTSVLTVSGSDSTSAAFAGTIQDGSGTVSFVRSGTGATTLSGSNTYTGGTTISGGTLKLGSSTTLADTGPVSITGGTFDLNGFDETVGSLTLESGSLVNAGSGTKTLTASSYLVKSGTISTVIGGTNATLIKNSDGGGTGGIVTLGTGNSYGGKTTINAGFIATSGESAFGASPVAFVADQITLNGGGIRGTGNINFNSNRGITLGANGGTFDTNGNSITMSNPLAGSGMLTTTGGGLFVLAADTGNIGSTNVAGGEFRLGATLNSSTMNVSSGATVSGTGSQNGTLILGSGSVARPGVSGVGTLHFTAATMEDGSQAEFALTGASTSTKLAASTLTVGSSNSSSAVFKVTAPSYTPQLGDVFDLLDWVFLSTSGDTQLADNLDLSGVTLGSGLTWNTSNFSNTGQISVAAVPEPSRVVLAIAGCALMALRRRRPAGL